MKPCLCGRAGGQSTCYIMHLQRGTAAIVTVFCVCFLFFLILQMRNLGIIEIARTK